MEKKFIPVLGRFLLGLIFLLGGLGKLGAGYAGTQGYMEAMGVPGMLLPLVILLEIGGGLAVILGVQTRWISYALAVFTIVAALIFHRDFANQMQMVMFLKNLSITGGLLTLAVYGPGPFSLCSLRKKN